MYHDPPNSQIFRVHKPRHLSLNETSRKVMEACSHIVVPIRSIKPRKPQWRKVLVLSSCKTIYKRQRKASLQSIDKNSQTTQKSTASLPHVPTLYTFPPSINTEYLDCLITRILIGDFNTIPSSTRPWKLSSGSPDPGCGGLQLSHLIGANQETRSISASHLNQFTPPRKAQDRKV